MGIVYVSVTKHNEHNELVIDEKCLKLNHLTVEHGLALMTTATKSQLIQKYGCVPNFNLPETERVMEEEENGAALDFHKPTMTEIFDEIFSVDDDGNRKTSDGYTITEENTLTLDQERDIVRKKRKQDAIKRNLKYVPRTPEEEQDELVEQWLAEIGLAQEIWSEMIRSK